MFIIITGNPVDGFAYEGPYPSHDDAVASAEDYGGDWWIAVMHQPSTFKDAQGSISHIPDDNTHS